MCIKLRRLPYQILSNARGNALILSTIVTLVMAGVGGAIFHESQVTSRSLQIPKIRSQLNVLEKKAIELALTPTSYLNCNTHDIAAAGDSSSCTLNTAAFDIINSDGFLIEPFANPDIYTPNAGTAPGTGRFSARISYTRNDVIRPSIIEMDIPHYVLQSAAVICPLTQPLFRGLDPNTGQPMCEALAPCSGPGQYIRRVTPDLQIECGNLNASSPACPADQYITGISWAGGAVTVSCSLRRDPFVYFDFTPVTFSSIGSTPSYACVNCSGSWTCDFPANGWRTYNITTPPNLGATPCPHSDGYREYNIGACGVAQDCVGSFVCNSPVDGNKTYVITTPESGGGAACPHVHGYVMYDTTACPLVCNSVSGSMYNTLDPVQTASMNAAIALCSSSGGTPGVEAPLFRMKSYSHVPARKKIEPFSEHFFFRRKYAR